MKTCPNCGEVNGVDRRDCWKCHTQLSGSWREEAEKRDTLTKICPSCKMRYPENKRECGYCYVSLERCGAVEDAAALKRAGREIPVPLQILLYILALSPLLGWIIGWICKGRDYYFGRRLMIVATVSFAVGLVLLILR